MATTTRDICPVPVEKVKFCLFLKSQKPQEIVAVSNWSLGNALQRVLKEFRVDDYIFFAQLNIHEDEVAVTPMLLCRWLKEGGKVRTIGNPKGNSSTETVDDHGDPQQQSIFFIKTSERRHKRSITELHYSVYEGKDLCVVASEGEKLQEALYKDKRLVNVEEFELHRCNDHESVVCLNEDVSDYHSTIFKVSAAITRKKSKHLMSEATTPPTIKKEVSIEDLERKYFDVYSSFSVTLKDSFTEEMGIGMIKEVKAKAHSTLLPPKEKRKSDQDLCNLATTKFANRNSAARPARVLETLARHSKSVGYLQCGTIQGTCFLLAENLVITCHHIINMINEARQNSTDPVTHAAIYVCFNYNYAGCLNRSLHVEVDETAQMYSSSELDFVFLWLKENEALKGIVPLGPFVSNLIPYDGTVSIVGHPDAREKLEETCVIIPGHDWQDRLYKRAVEKEENCRANPQMCAEYVRGVYCVHMYRGRIFTDRHDHQLKYDTSFFGGSSGSPVFDCDGAIVAMHTQGYPINDMGKRSSIMEFGVTFAAIYEYVKGQNSRHAEDLFPSIF